MRRPTPEFSNQFKEIFIEKYFFLKVKNGLKTIEVRPETQIGNINIGDEIVFRTSQNSLRVRTTDQTVYENLEQLLKAEDLTQIAPGFSEAEAINWWKKTYPSYQGKIVAIKFELLKK